MAENYQITYNIDLVLCIDSTGSMGPVIDMVKDNALHFYEDVMAAMEVKRKIINKLRVRVISFRDYLADGDDAMMSTDFLVLPDQIEEFSDIVNSIIEKGGGDEPEDGLEALGFAIRSKWDKEGIKKRQVIVVWTDASTHKLGFGAEAPNYPRHMAKSFNELTAWWGDAQNEGYVGESEKRLLLFAPDAPYWNTISENWDQVLHFPSKAGEGLNDYDYSTIIDSIANSI